MDKLEFRTAMSRLSAAVSIITTDGPGGRYGIVASAVCSVTDEPPTVLVCINRSSPANIVVKANRSLCVNLLSSRHQDLSARFATTPAPSRFEGVDWEVMKTGAPVLADAAVSLDCQVASVTEVGSHSVFFAEVLDLRLHDDVDGLVYFDRTYHHLTSTEAR